MIIREIPRIKGSKSSFIRLTDYINRYTPPVYENLLDGDSILTNGYIKITNFNSTNENIRLAQIEAIALQKLNTRSKTDKNMHLVVSFPKEDNKKLTKQLINGVEEAIIKELGFVGNQRISVLQTDTSYIHLHIAINKIDPKTKNNKMPYYSKMKLTKLGGELEKNLNLEITNHDVFSNKDRDKVTGKIADYEAHTGFLSFKSYLKDKGIKNIILDCKSWEEVHKALDDFNVFIKVKGNGLIFTDGKENLKCSELHRELSANKLKNIFGDFISRDSFQNNIEDNNIGNTKENYQKYKTFKKDFPKDILENTADQETVNLWEKYQEYKFESNLLKDLYLKRKQERIDLNKYVKATQYELYQSKNSVFYNKTYRRNTNTRLKHYKSTKNFEIKNKYDEKIHELEIKKVNIKNLNWKDFLRQEAANGNTQALIKLQKMVVNPRYSNNFKLSGEKLNFFKDATVNITKDGTIVYNKGKYRIEVGDDGIRTAVYDEQSILEVLKIAEKQYKDGLVITGTDDFKAKLVNISAKYDDYLNISFKDKNLEKQRLLQIDLNLKKKQIEAINDVFQTCTKKYHKNAERAFLKGKYTSVHFERYEVVNKECFGFFKTKDNKIYMQKISLAQANLFNQNKHKELIVFSNEVIRFKQGKTNTRSKSEKTNDKDRDR